MVPILELNQAAKIEEYSISLGTGHTAEDVCALTLQVVERIESMGGEFQPSALWLFSDGSMGCFLGRSDSAKFGEWYRDIAGVWVGEGNDPEK